MHIVILGGVCCLAKRFLLASEDEPLDASSEADTLERGAAGTARITSVTPGSTISVVSCAMFPIMKLSLSVFTVMVQSWAAQGGDIEDVSGEHGTDKRPLWVGATMHDVGRALILDTLAHTDGNRTRAASLLGISIRSLRNKLRDYAALGMVVPPPANGAP